jgi:hypothetical protein
LSVTGTNGAAANALSLYSGTNAAMTSLSNAVNNLTRYIMDEAHAGEKVAWSRVTNCATDDPRMAMLQIRNTQARNTRATNKTLHLVVSFPEGEWPTDSQLHAIEDGLCAALGMADHPRLSALHTNTAHVHLHVAVNRIHPDTLKCIDPSFGQRKLMVACRALEIAHNLSRDNHGLGPEEYSHNPVRGRAADMEAQSGRESFSRWVQDNARDDLLTAKGQGWTALHRAAASHGLVLRPRGAGLVITDTEGTKAVKASAVDRALSLPALEAACGPYQPMEPGQELPPAKERYEARPLQRQSAAKELYANYQKQRTESLEARTKEMAELRESQRAYRQQLGQWYREERKKLREGWLESLSPDKGARFRSLSQQRETLWERSKAAEKDGLAKIRTAHPLPGWIDWLQARAQRGDLAALEVLRSREAKSQQLTASLLRAETAGEAATIVLTHRRPVVGRDGRVSYRLDDGGLVQDQESRVAVTQESRAAAALAVTLAANRFGAQPLTIEGSAQFRQWVAVEAMRQVVA